MNTLSYILFLLLFVALGLGGYTWYQLNQLEKQYLSTSNELANTKTQLASSTNRVLTLNTTLDDLMSELQSEERRSERLNRDLTQEKERNEAFEEQIEDITDTVGTLDKLSKTDPELLQKYSKVFFLNEHYMPEKLVEIDKKYVYREDELEFISAKVLPFLEEMIEEANDDGVEMWVLSAYRSFDEQEHLKGHYIIQYGDGANQFSADQGFSEHQLGTTIDVTTLGLGGGLTGFETTEAYEWLTKNAHKFGFVLSYPPNNAYYLFEPWHWRFVGTDLARDLKRKDQYFYDLEQRDIDEYLISIFD